MANVLRRRARNGSYIVRLDGQRFVLDATTKEDFVDKYKVTEHPVEDGSRKSDHIQPMPKTVRVEGVVSNTPLFVAPDDMVPERAQSAYELLLETSEERALVTYVSRGRTLQNMAITEVIRQRGSQISANELRVSIALKQIRLVSSSETRVTVAGESQFAEDVADSAEDVSDNGINTAFRSVPPVDGTLYQGTVEFTGTLAGHDPPPEGTIPLSRINDPLINNRPTVP